MNKKTKMRNKLTITLLSLIIAGCGSVPTNNIKYTQTNTNSIKSTLSDSQKSELVIFAMNLLETKYNWGGKRPDFGLDCSGLISYVFKQAVNVKLTGAARDIVKHGENVPLDHVNGNLEVGDLLFFNTTGQSYSHVGMYIGNNEFLHASSKKQKVIITPFNKYYLSRLEAIKRI